MWIAFRFDSPLGYVIAVLGFAASVAVVMEFPARRVSKRRTRAAGMTEQSGPDT